MRLRRSHDWPTSVPEARAIQERLRPLVQPTGAPPALRTVAGLDVAYAPGSDHLAAAVVVLDAASLEPVATATAHGRARFGYAPGLLAFRELPALVEALERLTVVPDLLVCDGYGIAHPRRFGLACHIGVLTDLPSIGVAKTAFVGQYQEPALPRGSWSELRDGGELVGRVLRTRGGVKPVFVSVGHRISIDAASATVLRLCRDYRLPETTRHADHLSRALLRRPLPT